MAQLLLSGLASVKVSVLTEGSHRGDVGEFPQGGGSHGANSIFSSFSALFLLAVRQDPNSLFLPVLRRGIWGGHLAHVGARLCGT